MRSRKDIIPEPLPSGASLVETGLRIGDEVTPGVSLLCKTFGVDGEVAYRRQMMASDRLMTCMNIGLHSWSQTAHALEHIHRESTQQGFRIDRYQLNLDRRMGLPRELWAVAPRETGPMLESEHDWRATAQTVPIQPHLGDMMIGSPMSLSNARAAIEAGVSYIGNLSQFAWTYPMWPGSDVQQVAETIKALGLMAAKSDRGFIVHSYLDDGFGAQFRDYCSYVGWSLIEHYIVDELIGARVANAYGGLTHTPITKMAMILALERIKPNETLNPFYHGNTTIYSKSTDSNFAVLSIDVLHIMLAQIRAGSGVPTLPIPVTEALRIPTANEIVQAHTVARRIAELAPKLVDTVNWLHVERVRDQLIAGGRRFYDNVLQGLADMGIDVLDPMELLLALRRIGGAALEARFGAATHSDGDAIYHEPIIATDTYQEFIRARDLNRTNLKRQFVKRRPKSVVIVGSSDVHEYALELLIDALSAIGLTPINAGTSVDAQAFATLALQHDADAILVSTHNGMALTYAQKLRGALSERGLSTAIAMGGVLNEDLDGSDTPANLMNELQQLGIFVCDDIIDGVQFINTL